MGQESRAENMDRPGENLTQGKRESGGGREGTEFLGSKFPEAWDSSTVSDSVSSSGREALFPWEPCHGAVTSIPKLASRQRWSEEQKGLGKPLAAQRISSERRERRPRSLRVPS